VAVKGDMSMGEHLEFLLQRMVDKGLSAEIIPRLIRDVANILLDHRYATRTTVNEKLAYLGWGESILDETSLQLIILVLEESEFLKTRMDPLH
jgi:hypothetical protein